MNALVKRKWAFALLAVAAAAVATTLFLVLDSSGREGPQAVDPRLRRFAVVPSLYKAMGGDTAFPLTLSRIRMLSPDDAVGEGIATINFREGVVDVMARGLPDLPDGASYEVLLVENRPGPGNTVAIDWGPSGDDIIPLGPLALQQGGVASLRAPVPVKRLGDFEVDMVAIVRRTSAADPQFVIGSLTSLVYKLGRAVNTVAEEQGLSPDEVLFGPVPSGKRGLLPKAYAGGLPMGHALLSQIAQGQAVFFQETFNGNGRTCGTCHLANKSFTIDPATIASLPPTDPLFVFEQQPALANLENGALLRGPRSLILENIDGFGKAPVMRATPPLFNLSFTGPFGLSGEFASLVDFCLGAVQQHLTKSLNRVPGTDFRVPTQAELSNMEAFQLSLFLPADQDFTIDRFATTAAQQRGRDLFFGPAKCSQCHGGTALATAAQGLGGGNRNFSTGVVNLPINTFAAAGFGPLPAEAFGTRTFSTPGLFGVRDTAPYFHDHSALTLREAVAFYDTATFNASPGGVTVSNINLTGGQIDDLVAFLEGLVNLPPAGAVTGTVSGTVTLKARGSGAQGNVGHGLARVTLTSGATTLIGSVRQDGTFEIPRVPAGTYTATATAAGYLSAQRTGVVVGSGTATLPAVELRAGLVNADNVVNINDISSVVASFLLTPPTRVDSAGRFVDVNGDGVVDMNDISAMASNFLATSPTSWP